MNALSSVLRTAQRSYDRLLSRQEEIKKYQLRALLGVMRRLKQVEFVDPPRIYHPDNPLLGVVDVPALAYLPGEGDMEEISVEVTDGVSPLLRHASQLDPHSLDILVDALERFVRTHGVIRTKKVKTPCL